VSGRVRVAIVDDQGMVRSGFRSLISAEADLEVVAEAADGEAGVAAVRRTRPEVALMDIRMPVLDGVAATRRIVEAVPGCRVLVLTTYDLDEYLFAALRAGASGFLLKDAPADDLLGAIRTVARGDGMLAPSATRRLIETFGRLSPVAPDADVLAGVTAREEEVLRLVAAGLSNAEIATRLFVSEATAKTHVSSLLAKLGLRDRVQAVVFAYEHGIVVPGRKV
jgi:DNA-binding NarL/FixJ family response regulator